MFRKFRGIVGSRIRASVVFVFCRLLGVLGCGFAPSGYDLQQFLVVFCLPSSGSR